MIDIDQAFYDRMAADPELTALLNSYVPTGSTAGSGALAPAIFTDQEVPEDAQPPYVWSNGQITDIPDDTKLQPGREIVRDVFCYTLRNQTDLIDQIGNRIRDLFHRHALALDGALAIVAEANGPVTAPTDETVVGRVVSVRIRYENRLTSSA